MARYRKTSNADDRVGRGVTSSPAPTPTPMPSISSVSGVNKVIKDRVSASLPDYADLSVNVTIDEYLDSLSDNHLRIIGEVLRKARYSIRKLEDVKKTLSEEFADLDVGNFNKFLTDLSSQLIFKPGGPKESVSITQYGPEQIDAWVDNWLTSKAGRTLESVTPDQANLLRQAVKDYASSESVTTVTRDKKGRPVTTYKPGVTEAGIQATLQEAGGEMFGQEIERRQAFDFLGEVQKIMAGGQ